MDAVIDFPMAFDKINHKLFLGIISEMGIDVRVIRWIEKFLHQRTQRVRIGMYSSTETNITSGVLQESVLGALLFLIFISDLTVGMKC